MLYKKMFIVPGGPQALARPRMTNGRLYDAQKHYKLNYGLILANQLGKERKFVGPLLLEAMFFMDVKRLTAKRRPGLINKPHHTIPDATNLIKYLEDCAQNVLFDNDCLIYKIVATKIWSDNPRTEFIISELE